MELQEQIDLLENIKNKLLKLTDTTNKDLLESLFTQEDISIISNDPEFLEALFDDTSKLLKLIDKKLGILKGRKTKYEKRESEENEISEIILASIREQRINVRKEISKWSLVHMKDDLAGNRLWNLLQHNFKWYFLQARFSDIRAIGKLKDESLLDNHIPEDKNEKEKLKTDFTKIVCLDPGKIPLNFLRKLNLVPNDDREYSRKEVVELAAKNIARIKEIVATAIPLTYEDTDNNGITIEKSTDRVLLLQDPICKGKIMVFRKNTSLKIIPGATTRAEKGKKNTTELVNIYDDAYHFIRGQRYIIDEEGEKITNLEKFRLDLVSIMWKIKWQETEQEVRERIQKIINELNCRQTFYEMFANINQLRSLQYRNGSIDRNKILWADTNLKKEWNRLFSMMTNISKQLFSFEQKFILQQENIEALHSQFFVSRDKLAFVRLHFRKYREDQAHPLSKHPWLGNRPRTFAVEPFITFQNQIKDVLGNWEEFNKKLCAKPQIGDPMKKMEKLFRLQSEILDSYIIENKYKLGKISLGKVEKELWPIPEIHKKSDLDAFFDSFREPWMVKQKIEYIKQIR